MKDKTKSNVETEQKIMASVLLLTHRTQTESFSQFSYTLDADHL